MTSYALEVDWDADTSFTDESSRLLDFRVERGRSALVSGSKLAQVQPGFFSVTLDNRDGRYDPFNVASALYGYIKPNRAMTLKATADAVTYDVFTGWVRRIIAQSGRKLVRLEGYDGIDWLQSQNGILSDYAGSAELVDTAIETIIGLTSWDAAKKDIEANLDTIGVVWYDPEKSVWVELQEIAETYFGELFVSNDGKITYHARAHSATAELTLTESLTLREVQLQQPWDEIRNDLRMVVHPRLTSATAETLYSLGEKLYLAASATAEIYGDFEVSGDPAVFSVWAASGETPDYTAYSNPEGTGGSDRTANLTVTVTAYATRVKIGLENTSGTYDLYVTKLDLKGQATYEGAELVKSEVNAGSVTEYGTASLEVDTAWMQDSADATDVLGSMETVLSAERKVPEVTIVERPSVQFAADLFDVIEMDFDTLGIAGMYKITKIEHTWTGGEGCETRWRLEPTLDTITGLWTLGTSELGVGTYLV